MSRRMFGVLASFVLMYQFERPFVIDDTATRRELGIVPTRWEEVLQATVAK